MLHSHYSLHLPIGLSVTDRIKRDNALSKFQDVLTKVDQWIRNAKDNYNDVEAAMEFLRDRLIGDLPKVLFWAAEMIERVHVCMCAFVPSHLFLAFPRSLSRCALVVLVCVSPGNVQH